MRLLKKDILDLAKKVTFKGNRSPEIDKLLERVQYATIGMEAYLVFNDEYITEGVRIVVFPDETKMKCFYKKILNDANKKYNDSNEILYKVELIAKNDMFVVHNKDIKSIWSYESLVFKTAMSFFKAITKQKANYKNKEFCM